MVYGNIEEQTVRDWIVALWMCTNIHGERCDSIGVYRDVCRSAVLCKGELGLLRDWAQTRALSFCAKITGPIMEDLFLKGDFLT